MTTFDEELAAFRVANTNHPATHGMLDRLRADIECELGCSLANEAKPNHSEGLLDMERKNGRGHE